MKFSHNGLWLLSGDETASLLRMLSYNPQPSLLVEVLSVGRWSEIREAFYISADSAYRLTSLLHILRKVSFAVCKTNVILILYRFWLAVLGRNQMLEATAGAHGTNQRT